MALASLIQNYMGKVQQAMNPSKEQLLDSWMQQNPNLRSLIDRARQIQQMPQQQMGGLQSRPLNPTFQNTPVPMGIIGPELWDSPGFDVDAVMNQVYKNKGYTRQNTVAGPIWMDKNGQQVDPRTGNLIVSDPLNSNSAFTENDFNSIRNGMQNRGSSWIGTALKNTFPQGRQSGTPVQQNLKNIAMDPTISWWDKNPMNPNSPFNPNFVDPMPKIRDDSFMGFEPWNYRRVPYSPNYTQIAPDFDPNTPSVQGAPPGEFERRWGRPTTQLRDPRANPAFYGNIRNVAGQQFSKPSTLPIFGMPRFDSMKWGRTDMVSYLNSNPKPIDIFDAKNVWGHMSNPMGNSQYGGSAYPMQQIQRTSTLKAPSLGSMTSWQSPQNLRGGGLQNMLTRYRNNNRVY